MQIVESFGTQKSSKIESQSQTLTDCAHIFYLETISESDRVESQRILNELGIQAPSHYQPLGTSKFGKKYAKLNQDFPNSTKFSKTILRLPIWVGLENHLDQLFERLMGLSE